MMMMMKYAVTTSGHFLCHNKYWVEKNARASEWVNNALRYVCAESCARGGGGVKLYTETNS